jgi:carboxymethylenebutenolidase
MKKTLSIQSHDGQSFDAHVVYPETDGPAPAVVVIQEIFGVNAVMRGICEHLSQAGFIAICPDIFWRQERNVDITDGTEEEWQKAFSLYKGFNLENGVKDLISTAETIRKDAVCNGKVGSVGYCLGGRLAFLMATRSKTDCNVSYYGVALEEHLSEAPNIQNPLLMHIAGEDEFVPPPTREKIVTALKGNPLIDLRVYLHVGHAFARRGGKHYDEKAAQEANYATADFLSTHLNAG